MRSAILELKSGLLSAMRLPQIYCEFMHMQCKELHSLRRLKEFLLDAAGENIALVLPWGTRAPFPSSTRAIAYDNPKVHMNTCTELTPYIVWLESAYHEYDNIQYNGSIDCARTKVYMYTLDAHVLRCLLCTGYLKIAQQFRKKYGMCNVN